MALDWQHTGADWVVSDPDTGRILARVARLSDFRYLALYGKQDLGDYVTVAHAKAAVQKYVDEMANERK